jgi:uncharacterized membrane protein YqiK
VYDKVDYLSSLGKTQTAVVQRDADIGVAEAERDAGIRVCEDFLSSPQDRELKGYGAVVPQVMLRTSLLFPGS